MTLRSLLEDFGGSAPPEATAPPDPVPDETPAAEVLAEEERLAAFEKGYSEGYEDATRAAEEDRARVSEALSERLGALALTSEEVRSAVLREVRDLVAAIGDGVLPAMGREGFGPALAEAVTSEIEGLAPCPVTVSVAPGAVELVTPLMPRIDGFPVEVRGDPDLGEGQAVIALPESESEVDTTTVVERALAALREWVADADWTATATAPGAAAPDEETPAKDVAHG